MRKISFQRPSWVSLLAGTVASTFATATLAADGSEGEAAPEPSPWVFSLGLKAWGHEWTTWAVEETFLADGIHGEEVKSYVAKPKVAAIPVLSARYKRWLVSASAMTSTRYALQNSDTVNLRRREADANLGYDLMPGLTLIVGYKASRQDFGLANGSPHVTFAGPTLAINAAAPLASGVAIYGTYGFGRLKGRWVSGPTELDLPTQYSLGEWGLAYTQPLGSGDRPVHLTFTLGYRAQTIRTRDIPLTLTSADDSTTVEYGKVSASDFTHGLSLGVIASF
jgi:hypothetical protein